jgi:hypothetical protein
MKDLVIGIVTGIAAVLATALLAPRPQPINLPVRQVPPVQDQELGRLGLEYLPTSDPVRRKLDETIFSLKVTSAPLEGVVKQLADVSGQNLYVDWLALQAAGISAHDPITVDLHDLPVSVLLGRALQEAGRDQVRLGYTVIDGVVQISTEDDLAKYTVIRVYDVRDLVERERALSPNLKNDLASNATDALIRLIQETIDPTSWRDAGGSIGSIYALGGALVVRQSPQNQDAVLGLLVALRRSNAPWPTTRPMTTRGKS